MNVTPLASASVTLDGTGAGLVRVGPKVYGTVWNIARMITSCTDTTQPLALRVYRGIVAAGAIVDQSKSRGYGDTSETNITLRAGEELIAVYSGGTPGTVATFNIEGEQTR